MIPALVLAASLITAAPAPDSAGGEPLPPGAPTDDYRLAAWCYGALKEYLDIYEQVKPDLVDIDHMFGSPVQEAEPYQADMAAYRTELKLIGNAVTLAEKASPRPIAQEGGDAVRQGMSIWSLAEMKSHRELARAWLLWSLPDRCDSDSRQLAAKSALFGKALSYNNGPEDKAGGNADAGAAPGSGYMTAPSQPQSALEAVPPAPSQYPSAPLPSAPPPAAPTPAAPAPVQASPAQPAAAIAEPPPAHPATAEAAPPAPNPTPQAEAAPPANTQVVTTSPAAAPPQPDKPPPAPASPPPAVSAASASAEDQPMEPRL